MADIYLINRHGRKVQVSASMRDELLGRGYKLPVPDAPPAPSPEPPSTSSPSPESAPGDVPDVDQITKKEWLEGAAEFGVEVSESQTKAEIRQAIIDHLKADAAEE